MSVITLLTDFGDQDAYVAIMKGVILTINPRATIIDITHAISPQDVRQAAYLIPGAFRYFPRETVHIIVVDPGVGSTRAIIALRKKGHTFLAPDNGVLSLLLADNQIDAVYRVDNPKYFLHPVSNTFHGRDIFAPVGAHLALGLSFKQLGTSIDVSSLKRLDLPRTQISGDGTFLGAVIDVDRYGNLITNLDWNTIKWHYPKVERERLRINIGKHSITGLCRTYGDVGLKKPLVLVGSRGWLEISVNRGSAAGLLGAQLNTPVTVKVD
jgi:S-adenosylmethionine hydrolase